MSEALNPNGLKIEEKKIVAFTNNAKTSPKPTSKQQQQQQNNRPNQSLTPKPESPSSIGKNIANTFGLNIESTKRSFTHMTQTDFEPGQPDGPIEDLNSIEVSKWVDTIANRIDSLRKSSRNGQNENQSSFLTSRAELVGFIRQLVSLTSTGNQIWLTNLILRKLGQIELKPVQPEQSSLFVTTIVLSCIVISVFFIVFCCSNINIININNDNVHIILMIK